MRPMLVDGAIARAFAPGGKVTRILAFTFVGATIRDAEIITELDALAELAISDAP